MAGVERNGQLVVKQHVVGLIVTLVDFLTVPPRAAASAANNVTDDR